MYSVQHYIKENDIRVYRIYMEKLEGVAMERGGRMNIVVSDQLDAIAERETIAHEAGHIIDGTVDTHVCALSERSANRIGRSLMITYDKMREAIEDIGEYDLTILSQMFGCSYEFMEKRFHDLYPNYVS